MQHFANAAFSNATFCEPVGTGGEMLRRKCSDDFLAMI